MLKIFKPLTQYKGNAFYSKIVEKKDSSYIWGQDKRFDVARLIESPSVKKYFTNVVSEHIKPNDTVLEVGCGSGVFLNQTAALANHVYGCDISFDLLQLCQQYVQENNVGNVSLFLADAEGLPFENDSFDVVYMVDVLHHLYRVESSVDEVARVLKPSGKLLVHEPNKYNVLLALLCLIDRNEWGALRLGSKVTYRKLFDEKFSFELLDYNGLLIGPDSKCNLSIADFLLESSFSPLLEWLSPKVFMVLKLKNSM